MVVVQHPDESILLAFVRRQLRNDEWPGIQEHLAHCPQCRRHCAEYDQVGAFLRQWATSEYYATNPALTERVLQRINASTSVRERWQERVRMPSLRLMAVPVAIALVVLFSVVFFTIAYRGPLTGQGHNVKHIVLTPTQAVRNIRQTPTAKARPPTPTATVATKNDHDGGNSSSSGGGGNLYLCSPPRKHNAFVLQVCGSNFTPDAQIYLIFTVQGQQFQPRGAITADQSGDFAMSFIIPNCRFVPNAINAVDANNNQLAPTLSNIQVGHCSAQN